MNKSNARQFIPLIEALADGKIIQYRSRSDRQWTDINSGDNIGFNYDPSLYRIKPADPMIKYLVIDTRYGLCVAGAYGSADVAEKRVQDAKEKREVGANYFKVVKFVEEIK